MRLRRRPLAAVVAAAIAGGAASEVVAGLQARVRQVAGVVSPLGWPYSSFGEGIVAADGRLVFVASSSAVFADEGGPTLVQRIGAGVVLGDGRRITGVGPPARASDGCAVVRAVFESGGEAIVRACGTTFTVVVDAGTPAPGGGTLRAFDPTLFVAGTDVVAFGATLETGASVVLRRDGGGLAELARSGTGTPAGGVYAAFRVLGTATDGRVAFRATVSDGPDGLFVATSSARAVAGAGQGSPSGGSFTTIGGGRLHPSGRFVFRAGLSTGGGGLFVADLSGPTPLLQAIVLQGDALPIGSASIRGFPNSIEPTINASGAVAFRCLIDGATDPDQPSGIFVWSGGAITTIATVRGTLGDVGVVRRLRDPVIADDGSVVVSALVADAGPGLFVVRPGGITPLAVLGDPTEADTGDSRFRFGAARVTDTAEGAFFLGTRDAIFRQATDDTVEALAYTGRPTPLGGTIAALGPPAVDGRGGVFFGIDVRQGSFDEALLEAGGGVLETILAPERRLLGGGGILELFPTGLDALARPGAALRGVVLTAALIGARASEGVFAARPSGIVALARVGQRVGGQRLARLGTPSAGPGGRLAFLAEMGRTRRRVAVVAGRPPTFSVTALRGASTRSRVAGRFDELGPPVVGRIGAVFRATLEEPGVEGIFVAEGKRLGVVAASGDTTTLGARLRSFDDPLVVGDEVWFLARVTGSTSPTGVYRVQLSRVPRKSDEPLAVEPVLLPGTPGPTAVGGVIVGVSSPQVGPAGIVSVVADVGGGTRPSAILEIVPVVP